MWCDPSRAARPPPPCREAPGGSETSSARTVRSSGPEGGARHRSDGPAPAPPAAHGDRGRSRGPEVSFRKRELRVWTRVDYIDINLCRPAARWGEDESHLIFVRG